MWLFWLACKPLVTVPDGVLVVSQEQQATWQRNFNPLLISGSARWPTAAGIYEPLLIYNPMSGEYEPWLATTHQFDERATELRMTIREGVLWSDGQPFTPADVVFTFELLQRFPALDGQGLWQVMESVTHQDGEVVFRFQRPTFSGLEKVAHQPIVPQHHWSEVADPMTFGNETPVGTGPFTEIEMFTNQLWQLGQNPHYWQPLGVSSLRFPALPSNEQANLALLQGEIDWAANFVPAIDRIYVAKDPEHHHYWFPLVSASVLLYPNHTRAPLDNTDMRRALSLAIDRDLLVRVALHDYTDPADESGLSSAYDDWKMTDWEERDRWTNYDLERAAAILEQQGWSLVNGVREKNGERLALKIGVVSGWSDWVRAAQVIAHSLRQIGIDASVDNRDFGSWFQALQQGNFDLSLGWSESGPHPIAFYNAMMSAQAVKPIGEVASVNWHRYAHPKVDSLVEAFEATSQRAVQVEIARELQSLFVENVPAIPLFLNPSWGECNTTRFTGFPSSDNPYARLSPNHPPETLLVMTRLEQR